MPKNGIFGKTQKESEFSKYEQVPAVRIMRTKPSSKKKMSLDSDENESDDWSEQNLDDDDDEN